MAAAGDLRLKRRNGESASRSPSRRHVLFIEKPGEITALQPGKDGRSVMQFKYDPVSGNCYFLRVQIAFNVLKSSDSQSGCTPSLVSPRSGYRDVTIYIRTSASAFVLGIRSEQFFFNVFLVYIAKFVSGFSLAGG